MVSVSLAAMLAVAFVSCKADENTCAAGTPCPIEMDPEVGANLNLLQTSIHLHSEVDAEKTRMETDLKTMQNLKDQCDTWEKTDEFCKDGSTCCEGYGCGGSGKGMAMQCVPCDWKDYVFTTDSCKTGDAPGGGAGDPFAGTNCELLMHATCITQGDRCHYSRATQTCLPGRGFGPVQRRV